MRIVFLFLLMVGQQVLSMESTKTQTAENISTNYNLLTIIPQEVIKKEIIGENLWQPKELETIRLVCKRLLKMADEIEDDYCFKISTDNREEYKTWSRARKIFWYKKMCMFRAIKTHDCYYLRNGRPCFDLSLIQMATNQTKNDGFSNENFLTLSNLLSGIIDQSDNPKSLLDGGAESFNITYYYYPNSTIKESREIIKPGNIYSLLLVLANNFHKSSENRPTIEELMSITSIEKIIEFCPILNSNVLLPIFLDKPLSSQYLQAIMAAIYKKNSLFHKKKLSAHLQKFNPIYATTHGHEYPLPQLPEIKKRKNGANKHEANLAKKQKQ